VSARQLRRDLAGFFPTHDALRFLGRVTAFPASADLPGGLQTDDWCIRTDNDFECYYDGTQWLTRHEYNIQSQAYTPAVPGAAFYTGGVAANLGYAAPRTDYSLYMTRWVIAYILDTNQTGVNFWTLKLQTNAGDITTQDTKNAVALGNFYTREGNDNTVRTPAFLRLQASAKNGTPGGIYAIATWYYRLVVT
jgi:hypothetical protein